MRCLFVAWNARGEKKVKLFLVISEILINFEMEIKA